MAKKDAEAVAAEVVETKQPETGNAAEVISGAEKRTHSAAADKDVKEPEGCAAGFYCYIGPNLERLIQTGTIYRGTREEALAKAANAIAAEPLVKTLIISGDALPAARVMVRTPGNVLYANYQKLAKK